MIGIKSYKKLSYIWINIINKTSNALNRCSWTIFSLPFGPYFCWASESSSKLKPLVSLTEKWSKTSDAGKVWASSIVTPTRKNFYNIYFLSLGWKLSSQWSFRKLGFKLSNTFWENWRRSKFLSASYCDPSWILTWTSTRPGRGSRLLVKNISRDAPCKAKRWLPILFRLPYTGLDSFRIRSESIREKLTWRSQIDYRSCLCWRQK